VNVVVFGSMNMDLVVQVPTLPLPGQTLTGNQFYTAPGGKGANQAVGCARLGVPTCFVGRVGGDVFADELISSLANSGVETASIIRDSGQATGIASIAVAEDGQNTIVVIPGANGCLDQTDIGRLENALADARVLLLQLEIPIDIVIAAARAAHRRGIFVVLDPAPAQTLPPTLYELVDVITPNEGEAAELTGLPTDGPHGAQRAARVLLNRGVKQAVIKLGKDGAYWTNGSDELFVPSFSVNVVDTVGAGDAFNAGLAAALSEEMDIQQALQWATAAGALATTKHGAQPSMPNRQAVAGLLRGTSDD
jgi:ribokinase